ncbi:hypothetical protein [Tardiphaga sp. P9-11]|uniref:hypothetical protein n=1 Tax=Tardiphaga sp. P9-11 TaxID=2024614 RepID=UPI0011F276AB|nr:hypothetical protein [Tardiphaga sp. P9-11]
MREPRTPIRGICFPPVRSGGWADERRSVPASVAGWLACTSTYRRESDSRISGRDKLMMGEARDQLIAELQRLGAGSVVTSSNVRLREDAIPYADQRRQDDPGVAVYFMLKKCPMVMAVDRYSSVAGNKRALILAIEAMRQLERHGGRTMERAFTGFAAIAAPNWKKP